MPVRQNSIMSFREELAEIAKCIEAEKQIRHSLRISSNPDYYSRQRNILLEQMKEIQDKIDRLDAKYESAEQDIQESRERQKSLEKRQFRIRERAKFERVEKILEELKRQKAILEGDKSNDS
jgi:chromosome segregation ATPase